MSLRRALPAALVLGAVALVAACAGAPPLPEPTPTSTPTSTSAAPPTSTSASTAPVAPDGFAAIPRTKVSLRVPDGMTVDDTLPGLGKPGTRTSVAVVNLPLSGKAPQDALNEMAAGFTSPQAAAQGLELGQVQRLTIADHLAITTTGVQRANGGTYAKAIAVLAADDGLVMMTGTAESDGSLTAADLMEVLTSARWSK